MLVRPHLPSSHISPTPSPVTCSNFLSLLGSGSGLWQVPLLHYHSPLPFLLQHGEVPPPHPGKHSPPPPGLHQPPADRCSTTWCSTMSSTLGMRRLRKCCLPHASRPSHPARHRLLLRSRWRGKTEWTSMAVGLIPAFSVLPRPQQPQRVEEGSSVTHLSALHLRQRQRVGSRLRTPRKPTA